MTRKETHTSPHHTCLLPPQITPPTKRRRPLLLCPLTTTWHCWRVIFTAQQFITRERHCQGALSTVPESDPSQPNVVVSLQCGKRKQERVSRHFETEMAPAGSDVPVSVGSGTGSTTLSPHLSHSEKLFPRKQRLAEHSFLNMNFVCTQHSLALRGEHAGIPCLHCTWPAGISVHHSLDHTLPHKSLQFLLFEGRAQLCRHACLPGTTVTSQRLNAVMLEQASLPKPAGMFSFYL